MAALICSCWRMYRTATRPKSSTSWVMLKSPMGLRPIDVVEAVDEVAVGEGTLEES